MHPSCVSKPRKDCGLERFVPCSLLDSMKGKDLRKILGHCMKANQNLSAPGQKQLTALQAKLHYLKILGEVRSFGGKCFVATHVVSWKTGGLDRWTSWNIDWHTGFKRGMGLLGDEQLVETSKK